MTTLLHAVVTGDGLEDVAKYTSHFVATIGTESLLGIRCSDAIPRADGIEGVEGEVWHMLDVSEKFGGMFPRSSMVCAQWPFEAKESRPLDGVVETKNPVLLIGNTWDPTTGVHTAYKMSEMFAGSVVVEQKGFGVSAFLFLHSHLLQLTRLPVGWAHGYEHDTNRCVARVLCAKERLHVEGSCRLL
ncbi:alpha/beta hydrolase [Candidatus Bathyarchaeota archaeon]|nr:alpha/beta hydrolase [Candidatus Bathyarchaeota archaeon]